MLFYLKYDQYVAVVNFVKDGYFAAISGPYTASSAGIQLYCVKAAVELWRASEDLDPQAGRGMLLLFK